MTFQFTLLGTVAVSDFNFQCFHPQFSVGCGKNYRVNHSASEGPLKGHRMSESVGGERTQTEYRFHVFLCHNSTDKEAVMKIARELRRRKLRPWLDVCELQPGLRWQPELEKLIATIASAAVFVGPSGIGPWQDMEIEAILRQFAERKCPVIPVILTNVTGQPKLPLFLQGQTWVDFRRLDPDPLDQLVFGVKGVRPGAATRVPVSTPAVTGPPALPVPPPARCLVLSTSEDLGKTCEQVADHLQRTLGIDAAAATGPNDFSPTKDDLVILVQGMRWEGGTAVAEWHKAPERNRIAFVSSNTPAWPPFSIVEVGALREVQEFRTTRLDGARTFDAPEELSRQVGLIVGAELASRRGGHGAHDIGLHALDRSHGEPPTLPAQCPFDQAVPQAMEACNSATREIGSAPSFYPKIIEIVNNSSKWLRIATDFPAYGVFSSSDRFDEYMSALEIAHGRGVLIDFVFPNLKTRRLLHDLQFAEDVRFNELLEQPCFQTKLSGLARRLKSLRRPVPGKWTQKSFSSSLESLERHYQKKLDGLTRERKVKITSHAPPIYLWIADDERCVFSIPELGPGTSSDLRYWSTEHGFLSTDASLVRRLRLVWGHYVRLAKK